MATKAKTRRVVIMTTATRYQIWGLRPDGEWDVHARVRGYEKREEAQKELAYLCDRPKSQARTKYILVKVELDTESNPSQYTSDPEIFEAPYKDGPEDTGWEAWNHRG